MMNLTAWTAIGLLVLGVAPALAAGETTVARWKDNKAAAFLLMFDDSWPSHFQVAEPELAKRGLVATFYICPQKGEFKVLHEHWDNEVWRSGQVYGVHTLDHQGIADLAEARADFAACAKYIRETTPGKPDRLVSYARPGVKEGAWGITNAEEAEALSENRLIDRPTFDGHGAVYHWKTCDEMLALADRAIQTGGMEYLIVHGVERIEPSWNYQDYWALKQDIFLPLLDGLKERSDDGRLWVTDHISEHKYATERDGSTVEILSADEKSIRLRLTSTAAADLYDEPLTLLTKVPQAWTKVTVRQGNLSSVVEVEDGQAMYDALPGEAEIELTATT